MGVYSNSTIGLFEKTISSRRLALAPSLFIRAPHPKTEIRAERAAVQRALDAGWVGQMKIHGHRAQIHISADPSDAPIIYNRQGQPHQKFFSSEVITELRRLFSPIKDWSAIDAEWIKSDDKIYVFDFLKKDGLVLSRLNYTERHALLPKDFISPHFQVLPVLTNTEKCLEILKSDNAQIEGLVFKSPETIGFSDTSIVRCRKK